MAGAEAVATNFFHGCVFALRNSKPFVCETTPYRSQKLHGLMAKVCGIGHLVTEDTPAAIYNERLSQPLQEHIQQQIERLRQGSNVYLDRALAVEQLQVA